MADSSEKAGNEAQLDLVSWNFRVMLVDTPTGPFYEIREVYYDKDDNPDGWAKAHSPGGDTVEELRQELERMARATRKPVLQERSGSLVPVSDPLPDDPGELL